MTAQDVAEQFVNAINAHDIERLASRDAMREGWKFYFSMVADYNLDINRSFVAEDGKAEAMLVGVASGSYWSNGIKRPDSSWSAPVALRAVVRDDHIAEWQVYADNEPIREQMRTASV